MTGVNDEDVKVERSARPQRTEKKKADKPKEKKTVVVRSCVVF